MIVATLRVLSLQGASAAVIAVFTGVVISIIMAINVGFDKAKNKKRDALVGPVESEAPDFPVPSLPMNISTHNVSKGAK